MLASGYVMTMSVPSSWFLYEDQEWGSDTTKGGLLSCVRVVPGNAGTNGPDAWPRFHIGPAPYMGVKCFIQNQVINTYTSAGNGLGWEEVQVAVGLAFYAAQQELSSVTPGNSSR